MRDSAVDCCRLVLRYEVRGLCGAITVQNGAKSGQVVCKRHSITAQAHVSARHFKDSFKVVAGLKWHGQVLFRTSPQTGNRYKIWKDVNSSMEVNN